MLTATCLFLAVFCTLTFLSLRPVLSRRASRRPDFVAAALCSPSLGCLNAVRRQPEDSGPVVISPAAS